MRCKICGQSGVDGAYDQYGDFVCIDCFATGEAYMSGLHAEMLAPVPGFNYPGLAQKEKEILRAWNHEDGNIVEEEK